MFTSVLGVLDGERKSSHPNAMPWNLTHRDDFAGYGCGRRDDTDLRAGIRLQSLVADRESSPSEGDLNPVGLRPVVRKEVDGLVNCGRRRGRSESPIQLPSRAKERHQPKRRLRTKMENQPPLLVRNQAWRIGSHRLARPLRRDLKRVTRELACHGLEILRHPGARAPLEDSRLWAMPVLWVNPTPLVIPR